MTALYKPLASRIIGSANNDTKIIMRQLPSIKNHAAIILYKNDDTRDSLALKDKILRDINRISLKISAQNQSK